MHPNVKEEERDKPYHVKNWIEKRTLASFLIAVRKHWQEQFAGERNRCRGVGELLKLNL